MLSLKNITKDYVIGSETVHALKGVSMDFRDSEFVSVLGQSGCGKTTLLNIIGGLDKYSSGDLVINGKSTKKYKEKDWNTYRNHSIGFVFQSYNLIPHQSVLSNVELALTLSGVSKKERKQRAIDALNKVGLGDQIRKKPNQMSGGQMQRVAIARALVNDPDILLADEPTGALDSATSVQVMDILRDIAKDKLVIMVTHNPDLAAEYSTRIIKLFDGEVVDDSNPFTAEEVKAEPIAKPKKEKHRSMSLFTALGLSFNNLMTKKTRTFMTSFAGSIGIIGIALILSISTGLDAYINKVEEDTLSSYPLTIESTTIDLSSFMQSMMGKKTEEIAHEDGKIYSNDVITDMMEAFSAGAAENDLAEFKKYLESGKTDIKNLVSDIQYSYTTPLNIYKADTSDGIKQVNPGWIFEKLGMGAGAGNSASQGQGSGVVMNSGMTNTDVWTELLDNKELLSQQYEVLKGKMPEGANEAVVIVNKQNEISDYALYTLGIRDYAEVEEMLKALYAGEEYEIKSSSYSYDEILGLKFKLLTTPDCYKKENGVWVDKSEDELYMMDKLASAEEIKIVGIIRPSGDTAPSSGSGKVAYTSALTKHLVEKVNNSEMVKEQKEKPDTDVLTGFKFKTEDETDEFTFEDLQAYMKTLPEKDAAQMQGYMQQMKQSGMSDEKILETFKSSIVKTSSSTYEDNLHIMGVSDINIPAKINIYPKDFESKELITDIIDEYNKSVGEAKQITYTDYIGLMMSSITTIISAISYILIAFVAISLVVSSIMIGIITYISVLERTKEIGILRAIGASKRDISRVFNAETLIVGLTAGVIGIGATLLLLIPINAIIQKLTEISATAFLPTEAGIALVIISMVLTLVAGIIPSLAAAKKDPVIALRTE